jgi:hypothetical protein
MIKTQTVGTNGKKADVDKHLGLPAGGVVYTIPLERRIALAKPLLNPTFGADLNQDISFAGTPDEVHDGLDSTLWTASALAGTWVFNSTDFAQQGTRSIDATATKNNDEALFSKGSALTLANYTSFSGWVYLVSWGGGIKDIEVELRLAGAIDGVITSIADKIDTGLFDTWQQFVIPLEEFATGGITIDEVVIRTTNSAGAPQNYYLDQLQFEETGDAAIFKVEATKGHLYSITDIDITLADTFTTTLTDGTMPLVDYDKLMGLTALSTGINIKITSEGVTTLNAVARSLQDLLQLSGSNIRFIIGTGTKQMLKIHAKFGDENPIVLRASKTDSLSFTINDNLSGIDLFRIIVRGFETPEVHKVENGDVII